ncbi:MAG: HAD-IB family phosphatase [Candidatus Micrarchaeota archaeon]
MDLLGNPLRALEALKYLFLREKATVVIPCLNEGKTVAGVVRACLKTPVTGEVIVVDDNSNDDSRERAREAGARVVRHRKTLGKGAAIMTGVKAARNSVIVFVDADFRNITPNVVEALAIPVIENEAQVCKATFDREGGRLTELTAKPLLEFLFPEVQLEQPLSGQFAARKELLEKLELTRGWGIDIGVVLESIRLGERVVEVNIGRVEHKHRPLSELSTSARQIAKTILQKAGFLACKHKLIVFDFDKTLVAESSIEVLARKLGFTRQLQAERQKYYSGAITERELTRRIARMLKGRSNSEVQQASRLVRKANFAQETIAYLRRMGYKTVVVSYAFRQVIEASFGRDAFDGIVSPELDDKRGFATGKVTIPPWPCGRRVFCKGKAIAALMRRMKLKKSEVIAVGDSKSDEDMFRQAGVSVAIGGDKIDAAIRIKSLSELLIIAN